MEEERSDPDDGQQSDENQRCVILCVGLRYLRVFCVAACFEPDLKGKQSGNDKCRIADGVEWLRPEGGGGSFAVLVQMLVPIHETSELVPGYLVLF